MRQTIARTRRQVLPSFCWLYRWTTRLKRCRCWPACTFSSSEHHRRQQVEHVGRGRPRGRHGDAVVHEFRHADTARHLVPVSQSRSPRLQLAHWLRFDRFSVLPAFPLDLLIHNNQRPTNRNNADPGINQSINQLIRVLLGWPEWHCQSTEGVECQ